MQSGIDRSLMEFVVLLDIGSINVQVRFLCRLELDYFFVLLKNFGGTAWHNGSGQGSKAEQQRHLLYFVLYNVIDQKKNHSFLSWRSHILFSLSLFASFFSFQDFPFY